MPELRRNAAFQLVAGEPQFSEPRQRAQLGGNLAGELVVVEVEPGEVDEVAEF